MLIPNLDISGFLQKESIFTRATTFWTCKNLAISNFLGKTKYYDYNRKRDEGNNRRMIQGGDAGEEGKIKI